MRFLLQRDQKARTVDGHFSATCAISFLDVRYYITNLRFGVTVPRIFSGNVAQIGKIAQAKLAQSVGHECAKTQQVVVIVYSVASTWDGSKSSMRQPSVSAKDLTVRVSARQMLSGFCSY